jgi:Fe-S-cluster containining protein
MDACRKCALRKADCCSGEGYVGAFVTFGDIKRIMKQTRMEASEFAEFYEDPGLNPNENNLQWTNLHVKSKGKIYTFFDRNKMLMLKVKEGKRNKCMFLTSDGCSVFKARPLFCRLYPFWFEDTSKGIELSPMKSTTADENCLVCKKITYDNWDSALDMLNESKRSLTSYAKKLVSEIKLYDKYKLKLDDLNLDVLIKKL